MIKNFLITGDTHGRFKTRLDSIDTKKYSPSETAIIILGDAGVNFYLNDSDVRLKLELCQTGYTFYFVRGNHEERPENLKDIESMYDENVGGDIWLQHNYPNIRYFKDGGEYNISGHSVLTIGGAYSIDKWYRLMRKVSSKTWTGWFAGEQLTEDEMFEIEERCADRHFDFIITHTCPESWEPRDLFLEGIDQSTVDKTMEKWFDQFKERVHWGIWLFGHYHDDRLVRPRVEMYYNDIEELSAVWDRWQHPDQLDWWLKKDPNYETELH